HDEPRLLAQSLEHAPLGSPQSTPGTPRRTNTALSPRSGRTDHLSARTRSRRLAIRTEPDEAGGPSPNPAPPRLQHPRTAHHPAPRCLTSPQRRLSATSTIETYGQNAI